MEGLGELGGACDGGEEVVELLVGQLGRRVVVVGALHLLGEDGVVEKLRAAGYEVERICSACE